MKRLINRLSAFVVPTTTAFAIATVLTPSAANADCASTTVTGVLDHDTGDCLGFGGFKTADSAGLWICSRNEAQTRLALAAFLSGKNVGYALVGDSNCNPDSSYNENKAPSYLFVF